MEQTGNLNSWVILKRVFQENKAHQIFLKIFVLLPCYRRVINNVQLCGLKHIKMSQ